MKPAYRRLSKKLSRCLTARRTVGKTGGLRVLWEQAAARYPQEVTGARAAARQQAVKAAHKPETARMPEAGYILLAL